MQHAMHGRTEWANIQVTVSAVRGYLLCYDIADPVRLRRVHRAVRTWGLRIQYSVYYLEVGPMALDSILAELARHIRPGMDDVRVYPIPARCRALLLGMHLFPIGATIAGTHLPAEFVFRETIGLPVP